MDAERSWPQTAGLYIVIARTDKEAPPHNGLSLFLVEADTPGFSRGPKLNKMGMHGQDTSELFFDNCRIPMENILGEPGKGFYYFMHHLAQERLVFCLMAQGMAEATIPITFPLRVCAKTSFHLFNLAASHP